MFDCAQIFNEFIVVSNEMSVIVKTNLENNFACTTDSSSLDNYKSESLKFNSHSIQILLTSILLVTIFVSLFILLNGSTFVANFSLVRYIVDTAP